MKDLKVALEETMMNIIEVTDYFYKQQTSAGYACFQGSLEQMTDTVDGIYAYKQANENFSFNEVHLVEILREALQAMEDKDPILMSDVLQYELLEELNKVKEQL